MVKSKTLARWLLTLEIPILLALYIYFIFTDTLPFVALGIIFANFAIRAWLTHRLTVNTPFDIPIIFLLVLLHPAPHRGSLPDPLRRDGEPRAVGADRVVRVVLRDLRRLRLLLPPATTERLPPLDPGGSIPDRRLGL